MVVRLHHLVIGVCKLMRLAFRRHRGLAANVVHSGKSVVAWLE
jgi:hypothetical protein